MMSSRLPMKRNLAIKAFCTISNQWRKNEQKELLKRFASTAAKGYSAQENKDYWHFQALSVATAAFVIAVTQQRQQSQCENLKNATDLATEVSSRRKGCRIPASYQSSQKTSCIIENEAFAVDR